MRKKILIALFLIILIFESIIPIKVSATSMEEYDTKAGILLEPTVELVLAIADSIISAVSSFMTETKFDFVMQKEITNLEGEATGKHTIEDMTAYENALGLSALRYPNFTYSPEEIFAGNIDLLDINFLDDSNENQGWKQIRSVIAQWYKILRMVAIIGLLSVLIYTGIKIIISSSAKDKAKYKEWIINWFIAVVLVFSLHYIMAFILEVIEQITGLLKGLSGIIQVYNDKGEALFKTNLIGLVRFKIQEIKFTSKIFYLIMYVALITYTIKFTFLYFKRVLMMAFLTIISPIVALTYPIDKLKDGKAQGFEMWLKEYLYNVLLQPLHYILYYILVTTALSLAATNPLYGVVALMFISQAEKLLKQIFGFNKAKNGTVGGIAGAFATGAITAGLMNVAKDPTHPIKAFIGGKSSGKSGGKTNENQSGYFYDNYELNDVIDDINPEDFVNLRLLENNPNQNEVEQQQQSNENTALVQIADYERGLQNPFQSGAVNDEFNSDADADVGIDTNTDTNIDIPSADSGGAPITISTTGATNNEQDSSEDTGIMDKIKNAPVIKGVANVGKTLLRPAWDLDQDPKANAKRLGGNLLRGAIGAGVGITAAAVQAGVSITDGKYNAMEGAATIGAGIAGVSQIGKKPNGITQTYKQAANEGQDGKALKEYTEQWYNRDDVIKNFNKDFPGKGKEMRARVAKNYVSRGITDFKEQKQAIKFAELLKKERKMEEDDADRVAAATLRYKQNTDKSIIYDDEKRQKFIDKKVEAYTGSASKSSVRRVHEEFLQNIIDFDRANG